MTLVLAMLLDAWLGEPKWLWNRAPHPVTLMGRLISWVDKRFNRGADRRLAGILSIAWLSLLALALGALIAALPFGWVLEALIAAILLAHKSLVEHVSAVANALRRSLEEGRIAVAQIVGRDTAHLDEPAVARAAIESAAESASDGVVAPIFWFAVAGLPGILMYKMVNTADSMVGYLTPRHAEFGWATAKLDDLLNLVPARLTALMIALLSGLVGAWRAISGDARRHRSPNAGWPESAMARAINVALSGPRSYEGQIQHYEYVHADGRKDIGPEEIDQSVKMLWRLWRALLGLAVCVALVWALAS